MQLLRPPLAHQAGPDASLGPHSHVGGPALAAAEAFRCIFPVALPVWFPSALAQRPVPMACPRHCWLPERRPPSATQSAGAADRRPPRPDHCRVWLVRTWLWTAWPHTCQLDCGADSRALLVRASQASCLGQCVSSLSFPRPPLLPPPLHCALHLPQPTWPRSTPWSVPPLPTRQMCQLGPPPSCLAVGPRARRRLLCPTPGPASLPCAGSACASRWVWAKTCV